MLRKTTIHCRQIPQVLTAIPSDTKPLFLKYDLSMQVPIYCHETLVLPQSEMSSSRHQRQSQITFLCHRHRHLQSQSLLQNARLQHQSQMSLRPSSLGKHRQFRRMDYPDKDLPLTSLSTAKPVLPLQVSTILLTFDLR